MNIYLRIFAFIRYKYNTDIYVSKCACTYFTAIRLYVWVCLSKISNGIHI